MKLLKIISILLLAPACYARPFNLNFTPSVSESVPGFVQTYSMWAQPTNEIYPNSVAWKSQCNVGFTAIPFDSTNLPSNPCWITATANGSNNVQSPFAVPILFDTNDYPMIVITNAPTPMLLLPPTGLSVTPLN